MARHPCFQPASLTPFPHSPYNYKDCSLGSVTNLSNKLVFAKLLMSKYKITGHEWVSKFYTREFIRNTTQNSVFTAPDAHMHTSLGYVLWPYNHHFCCWVCLIAFVVLQDPVSFLIVLFLLVCCFCHVWRQTGKSVSSHLSEIKVGFVSLFFNFIFSSDLKELAHAGLDKISKKRF